MNLKGRLRVDLFYLQVMYYCLVRTNKASQKEACNKNNYNMEVIIMKKGLTEIVYILDRSGSMRGLEKDTIGGFNSMMDKQKETGEDAYVSTILFDNECEVLHDRVPIDKVEEITDKQYYVRGCTALLDAVGRAIHHIGNIHKYARAEDRPEKTIFVITTDGMENASREYSYERIQKMIKHQQEKYNWEFIFIGANIDAYAEAGRFGIREDRAVNYVHDDIGTATVFEGVAKAVRCVMSAPSAKSARTNLTESGWDEEINEDFKKRGKK